MTLPPLSEIAFADFGSANRGEINGDEITIALSIKNPEIDKCELVIYRANKAFDRHDLNKNSAPQRIKFDTTYNITSMAVIAWVKNVPFRFREDAGFFLGRLLSTNERDINKNLRWFGRIPHLPTRWFAARNSMAATPGEPPLLARCLVSFAYEAIESGRDDMAGYALDFCRSNAARFMAIPDVEVRSSILAVWAHLEIWSGSVSGIDTIGQWLLDGTIDAGVETYPRAIFNVFVVILLVGGIWYERGRRADAAKISGVYYRYFQISANKNPQELFREMVEIVRRANMCRILNAMSEGRHPEGGSARMPAFDLDRIWMEGNRLNTNEAREKFRQVYRQMAGVQ